MNLSKLFKMQKGLDQHIIEEKGLEGQDLLDKKILALQVELGELAQNWRGFKFWSENQEPRYETVEIYVHGYDGPGTNTRASIEEYRRTPILEEYVDCLHFILSIGLELRFEKLNHNTAAVEAIKRNDITSQFNYLFDKVGDFSSITNHNNYMYIVPLFLGLGEMLGFTWEQIEQAYIDKNKVNHERQESGY